ncbi:MAG: helix-turn-helix domain-containing protein [Acidobacteriota bacterium]|nr:helix-turn-helix domain-containing protein [Acidobacteriota bacterium]
MEAKTGSKDDLDLVWRALANPVRREILDVLKERPLPTGELADRFEDLSRFAVMQHLGVLEEGDLVVRQKRGRVTINHFNPIPIQRIADRWIDRMRRPWAESLVDLKTEIETEDEDEEGEDPLAGLGGMAG